MILADWEIRALCIGGMVSPFDAVLLNPASLDVRMGPRVMIESAVKDELIELDISVCTEQDPFLLQPGQFILAETQEVFHLPDHIAAEFRLKSSRARSGLDQALAVWADPGWNGSVLTMELRNNRQLRPIPLWPGMRIGQMVFHLMHERPLHSYAKTGRYNGDVTVTGSKG